MVEPVKLCLFWLKVLVAVPCLSSLCHVNAIFLQGIMARVYETSVVLFLLAILVTSIVWVGLALIDRGRTSDEG